MNGVINKETIKKSLSEMGLKTGDCIMLHSSLSSIGHVNEGANGLVMAFIETIGLEGCLIAPIFRSAIRSEYYGFDSCENCSGSHLCGSNEKGFTGAVSESIRLLPNSIRSCHPTSQWVGYGEKAKPLLCDHYKSPTQCGKGSPFLKLLEHDGFVILIGVGINSFTNIHSIEDVLNVPYLGYYDKARRHSPYTISARRIQYQYPLLLEALLKEAEIIKYYKIGAAKTIVIKARDIGSFLWKTISENIWGLALRPRGKTFDLFEDACLKINKMLKDWRKSPDKNSWEAFLTKSNEDIIPNMFQPTNDPCVLCPAYAGVKNGYHRCKANDPPPWESFIGYPPINDGVATCEMCSWPEENNKYENY